MIPWVWLPVVGIIFFLFGFFLAALIASNPKDDHS